jgi:DNA-binding NarL/FixJ family response regulator
MKISVILVDDQAMVRAGFRMLLDAEHDIEVVGEAENGATAVKEVGLKHPDVILMDIQMPVMDGLEAMRRITRAPDNAGTRVLILTTFERDEYIFEALRAGAAGFILKNAPPEDLIQAIRVVAEGDALLAPSVTQRIIAEFAKQPIHKDYSDEVGHLTDREIQVLRLISRGKTNDEIARELIIGEATVKTHVSNLLTKLSLRDRVQAVVFAYESGIVQPGNDLND